MKYQQFLELFDKKLAKYFDKYKDFLYCKKGCADCCKCGEYPMSQLEFEYLMQGYIALDDYKKQIVQHNIKNLVKNSACPFLEKDLCLIYPYRPIVCRVHGLAYKGNRAVTLPHCANNSKNFSTVYKNNEITIEPILENLDTPNVLKDFNYGEIRSLYDWFKF